MQTPLSLLDILSAFYAKLAKLLNPSLFLRRGTCWWLSPPHTGVSFLHQNQTAGSTVNETLWRVALGSTV